MVLVSTLWLVHLTLRRVGCVRSKRPVQEGTGEENSTQRGERAGRECCTSFATNLYVRSPQEAWIIDSLTCLVLHWGYQLTEADYRAYL
jgi:hypothetical protein